MAKKTNDIIEIALSKLTISEQNVRKQATSVDDLKVLMASIEAIGLLHPLMVVPGKGKSYGVVAGGRRLAALAALVEEGKLKPDHKVYCREVAEGISIDELSLMENMARVSMSPVDELKAFELLKTKDLSEDDIARHFGITVVAVKRRLKLARVAEPILDAYQAGEVTLDDLQAYAVTDDQERQVEHFQNAPGWNRHPHNIKSAMARETYPVNHKFVKCIGLEAYEKAGGSVLSDLFSEDVFLEDTSLVEGLVKEKLEVVCTEQLADGWKWAEVAIEMDYSLTAGMGRVYPGPVEPSKEVSDELAQIEISIDAFDVQEDDFSEEQQVEYDELHQRQDELNEGLEAFTPEDKAMSGVLVSLNYSGEINLHEGLVRPEDIEEETEGEDTGESTSEDDTSPTYSQALLDSLRDLRCKAMQADIARNPDLAFDLLLYSMVKPLFSTGYVLSPLAISPTEIGKTLDDAEKEASSAWLELEEIKASFRLTWSSDAVANFDNLSALGEQEKLRLLAYSVARTLHSQLAPANSENDVIEHAARLSGLRIRDYWWPTVDAFCSRIKIKDLLKIGSEIVDVQWGLSRSSEKKAVLAKAVTKLFDPENASLTEEQRARAAEWLPEIMAVSRITEQDLIDEAEPVSNEVPAFLEEVASDDPDNLESEMLLAAE